MTQPRSKGTILVVDDEASVRTLLTELLEDQGYTVLTASGGAAGLARARAEEPDLIILDIMMDDMDGTEVASLLREAPRTAGIPIIYLTGLLSEQEAVHQTGRGRDLILPKPFDARVLLEHIERRL